MKTVGQLTDISLDYKTKKPRATIEMDANAEDLESLGDKLLDVEIKVHREKRSLEANAYFWVLCTKIAEVIGESVEYVHNYMLRRYGQLEIIEGKAVYVVVPDTDEAAKIADEAETFHLKPTAQVKTGKDGKPYRTYMLLRGSHEYDTKEMSVLIDGVVREAKQLDIETLTPTQLQEMMASYENQYNAKKS